MEATCLPVLNAMQTNSAPIFTRAERDGEMDTATAAKRPVQRPTAQVLDASVASSATFSERLITD